jgi:hypothetical protein
VKRNAAAALALLALTACASAGGGSGGSGGSSCAPAMTGTLAAGVRLQPMAGRFVLTMTATGGAQSGRSVAGYLTLREAPAGTPAPAANARTALIGTTDVILESVGALRLGDTGAEDARAPGVAVYEQRAANGAPTVTARVGSHTTAAPTPGLQQIEGSFTVLFVRRIEGSGFAGGWQSGGPEPGATAQGYFCAARIG